MSGSPDMIFAAVGEFSAKVGVLRKSLFAEEYKDKGETYKVEGPVAAALEMADGEKIVYALSALNVSHPRFVEQFFVSLGSGATAFKYASLERSFKAWQDTAAQLSSSSSTTVRRVTQAECEWCNRTGHSAVDCKDRRATLEAVKGMRCHNCGQVGHLSVTCTKPAKPAGPCYQWAEKGTCKFGDRCRFTHN